MVGIQLVIWTLSGAYMVLTELDFIHGDHLLTEPSQTLPETNEVASLTEVLDEYPEATAVTLLPQWLEEQWTPVYRVSNEDAFLVDATTLQKIELVESAIAAIAAQRYVGDAPIEHIALLTDVANAPTEIPASLLPVWQVQFAGLTRPTLYLHPSTGEVLTQRHNFWRVFDFAWMLHIMDYEERVDVQNLWLKVFVAGNILLLISGFMLLLFTLRPAGKERRKL